MGRLFCEVSIGCLLVLVLLAGSASAQEKNVRELSKEFGAIYGKFVHDFRESGDTDQRFQLLDRASAELHSLLLQHVKDPDIAHVLPRMNEAKLVDLEPTYLAIIQQNSSRNTRALALFGFAQYSGNNERFKACETALALLKESFGDVPYQGATFAKAADESMYYFRNVAVGAKAPAMVGEDADGAVFRLADYRGKVVMLRFWGNWCPACRQMYGFERELVEKYKNQPFALIGVNSDSREECKRAQRESNLTWRSVWDGGDTAGPVAMVNRVHNWPTIIVIDAEGTIRYRSEGLDKRKLNKILDRFIGLASEPGTKVVSRESSGQSR